MGVGLGLPGFVPGQADKKLMGDAMRQSEETLIEQAMLEDKVKATDWEATNEAIEEQVARESYIDWLRENERRSRQQQRSGHSATTSSNACELRSPRTTAATSSSARNSPKPSAFVEHQRKSPNASPRASGSRDGAPVSPIASPAAGTSSASVTTSKPDWGLGPGFELAETASFLGQLPPDVFGKQIPICVVYVCAKSREFGYKKKRFSRLGGCRAFGSGVGCVATRVSGQVEKESRSCRLSGRDDG